MKTSFARFRIWPLGSDEWDGVWAFGRNAQEAAEEAFLDFVDLCEPPARIVLNCRNHNDGGSVTVSTVEISGQKPFLTSPANQPAFSFA